MVFGGSMANLRGKYIVAVLVATVLASCGGGGQSPTETPDPPPNPTPQTEPVAMRSAMSDLLDFYANPISYTTLSQIPTTGSARYTGYLSGELSNSSDTIPDSLIANLTIDVEFGATTFVASGQATNFFDDANEPVTGSLVLAVGQLDRSGNPNDDATFTMTADGQLTTAGGDQFDISSRLEGDFLGAQHNALGGAALGRATAGGQLQDFDGSFIAAR